jgi:hypothetical protein
MTSALFYGFGLLNDRTRTRNVRLHNIHQKHQGLTNPFFKLDENTSRNFIYFETEPYKRNNYQHSAVPCSSNSLILWSKFQPRFVCLSVCLSVCLFAALIIPCKPCLLCSVLDVVIKIFIRCHCLRHHAPLLQVLPAVPDFSLNFREIRFVPGALVKMDHWEAEWGKERNL